MERSHRTVCDPAVREGGGELGALHASAHERRYHEVKQVAAVLRALGIEPTITAATEAFFARSASLGLVPAASMDEVVRRFNERL